MHVGLPCMKLSLSPSTQMRSGKKAATCSVSAAWNEMNDERRGRDRTIDRSQTHLNIWIRGSTDMDMNQEVQHYIDLVNEEKKAHGKRSLRCDAVTGLAIVEKPPMDYMMTLSREEQIRFLTTSGEVIDEILKEIRPDWITVAQVMHFDENCGASPHTHRIVIPLSRDEEGLLTFNAKKEVGLKSFNFLNHEYPKRMRERGYEMVEDCRCYDQMTEEEKEEHRRNPPENGLDAVTFKKKKAKELEEQIRQCTETIAGLDADITARTQHITELAVQEDIKRKELSGLEETVKEKLATANNLQEEIAGGKHTLQEQRAQQKENDRHLSRQDESIAANEGTLAGQKEWIRSNNGKISALQEKKDSIDAAIALQQERYVNNEMLIERQENHLNDLTKRISDAEAFAEEVTDAAYKQAVTAVKDVVREETTNANLEVIRDIRTKVVEGRLPIPAEHRDTAIKLLNTVINTLLHSIRRMAQRVMQKLQEPETMLQVKEPVRESVLKKLHQNQKKAQTGNINAAEERLEKKQKNRQETLA